MTPPPARGIFSRGVAVVAGVVPAAVAVLASTDCARRLKTPMLRSIKLVI